MQEIENSTEFVTNKKVSCDGGNGPLGHPLVYLDMGDNQEVICPYCNKKFILENK